MAPNQDLPPYPTALSWPPGGAGALSSSVHPPLPPLQLPTLGGGEAVARPLPLGWPLLVLCHPLRNLWGLHCLSGAHVLPEVRRWKIISQRLYRLSTTLFVE